MSQAELLQRVVAVLSSAGIDYMVTGSVVSSQDLWKQLKGQAEAPGSSSA